MKIYIAGMFTNGTANKQGNLYTKLMNDTERHIVDEVENQLESYHYVKSLDRVETMRRDGAKVFLDSGAFSAFTLGKTIDLPAYCEYIKRNYDLIQVASVLDGIGDPLKTWQNQEAMEEAGTSPLPCFHYGEDERYLEFYLDHYSHITLGGMVPISNRDCKIWLDRMWGKYLTNEDGRAKLKVHGFGMTSVDLINRYPWFSVDSSTWVQVAAFGNIMFPINGRLISIPATNESPAKKKANSHIENFDPISKEAINREIEQRGFSVERLSSVYISRWVWNILMFREIEKMAKDTVFKTRQTEIFQ